MNIDLSDFYFGNVIAIAGLIVIIYFSFFVKEPKNEEQKKVKSTLYLVRRHLGGIIVKIFVLYAIVSLAAQIIKSMRDIPYIVNGQSETAVVETLTGLSGNTRSQSIYVRNLDTGDVFQIKVRKKPIEVGKIYDIEYLPYTGWASLTENDNDFE